MKDYGVTPWMCNYEKVEVMSKALTAYIAPTPKSLIKCDKVVFRSKNWASYLQHRCYETVTNRDTDITYSEDYYISSVLSEIKVYCKEIGNLNQDRFC
jgi:hypothetical protein